MVFSSIPFLFFFLPVCLFLYGIVPSRFRNTILLAFSLFFYAWGEPVYLLLLLFISFSDYTNGRLMARFGTTRARRRMFLLVSVGIDLSVLAFFKYADFLIHTVNGIAGTCFPALGLGLPVGISFFTFQTMSYIIDLYREEVPAEHSYRDYLTYVSMFPQLVAGPIVRYSAVRGELRSRQIGKEDVQDGVLRFLRGLFKKVLLANQIGRLWEEIHRLGSGEICAATAWLGALAFTLQLYFDFSAYSDMAIGMGRMLGFHFPENFRYPLSSVSITDFWRRWHISLGTWFRDYVYIPLGGNRRGMGKHLRNILTVWFLTGLWHGASWNFVLWGLYHGLLLILEKYVWGERLKRSPKWVQHLYALTAVTAGFVLFVCEDTADMTGYLCAMAGRSGNGIWGSEFLWYAGNYGFILLIAVLLAFPLYPWLREWAQRCKKAAPVCFALSLAGYAALFLLSVSFLVSDTYNPFLYFRF